MIQSIHGVKEISYPNQEKINREIDAIRARGLLAFDIQYVFNKYGEAQRAFVTYGLPVK